MKRTFGSIFISLFLFIPIAVSQDSGEEILMTIHDRKIRLDEFERIYKKNNSNTALEQQSVEEYLELFINFKLKVIEAEERGLDTTEAFINEFNGYKKQLAQPYITDQEEVDELVREAYDRAQYDIHAAHILIRVDEYASPEDTAKAYRKAIEIRDRILTGEDFGTVARATSDDPSAKNNSGDLGYFTVFKMVYPFESGVYNTKKDEISQPVRTRFGYHLIKVHDIRPAQGSVKVAHIMVLTPQTMTDEEKAEAKKKIYQYYDSLRMGYDFHELAKKYSEDRGSAMRGGELDWFETGRMVPEFESTAFALINTGDYSEPLQTAFGWHIIKLLDKKQVNDFEKMKPELLEKVKRSDRSNYARKAMITKIKNQNKYKDYPENIRIFYQLVDSTIFDRNWKTKNADQLNEILFTLGDKQYLQRDFSGYLENKQGGRKQNIEVYVNQKYESFVEESVLLYQEDLLPDKYPDYRYLLQEYHDGILLFDLTDKLVWSKAVEDTTGLEAYYKKHKQNYMWEKRMDATLFTCKDEDIANFARSFIEKKSKEEPTPEQITEEVKKEFNDSTCISFVTDLFEKGDHELVDTMNWDNRISENMNYQGDVVFIVKNNIIKPGPKLLDDARGIITADYQNYLEKEWIKELREKYSIHVNKELLSRIE